MTTTTTPRAGRPRTDRTPVPAVSVQSRPAPAAAPAPGPTEDEIRAAIAAHGDPGGLDDLYGAFDAVGDLWTDLRPSEHDRLVAMIDDAEHRAFEHVRFVIQEAAFAVAMAFAAEYPDARRAT